MTRIACWPLACFRRRSHLSLHQSAAVRDRWMVGSLIVLLQCVSLLAAQAQTPNSSGNDAVSGGTSSSSNSNSPSSGYESNPFSFGLDFAGGHGIEYTLAVLMVIWGTMCLFLGVRLFKFTLFALAWICVGGLTYYLSMLASSGDARASFIAAMLIGLLAGLLAVRLFVLGLVLAGAFTAFVLWSAWLTLFPHIIPAGALYTALAVVLLVGGIVAWWYQKWILLFATPVLGTFLLSEGLSKFEQNDSLSLSVFDALHGRAYCTSDNCFGLFAGLVAVALLGLGVQWFFTSGLRSKAKRSSKAGDSIV